MSDKTLSMQLFGALLALAVKLLDGGNEEV